MLVRLALALLALPLLAIACTPPEAVPQVEDVAFSEAAAVAERDQDAATRLGGAGLGKGDFARIEADLECVASHFGADAEGKAKAVEGVYRKAGASAEWMDSAREYIAAVEQDGRIRKQIDDLKARTCPGGTLSESFLQTLLAP